MISGLLNEFLALIVVQPEDGLSVDLDDVISGATSGLVSHRKVGDVFEDEDAGRAPPLRSNGPRKKKPAGRK